MRRCSSDRPAVRSRLWPTWCMLAVPGATLACARFPVRFILRLVLSNSMTTSNILFAPSSSHQERPPPRTSTSKPPPSERPRQVVCSSYTPQPKTTTSSDLATPSVAFSPVPSRSPGEVTSRTRHHPPSHASTDTWCFMYFNPDANDLRHQPPLELQPLRIPRKPCNSSSNG